MNRGAVARTVVVRRRAADERAARARGPGEALPVARLDERALVRAARTDADAFAELYRRYVERIHGFCYRRSGSQQVAEDVTAATFEKALRGLGRFRWREPGIGPWLFRIAANELVDQFRLDRRQARIAETLSVGRDVPSSPEADRLADRQELHEALCRIRPRYQRALSLRYFADLTNEEAAAAMGVSRATMAVIVHRSGAALRRAIEAARAEGANSHG